MEKLEKLPQNWEEWGMDQKKKAHNCLINLAEKGGLLHNDVRPCNFGIRSNGEVLVFDLEDLVEKSNNNSFQSFKMSMDRLLLF
jgi:hypothetical protein